MSSIKYLAGDGKTVLEIKVSEYLDKAIATSYVNGKRTPCGDRPVTAPANAPAGVVAMIGGIGLKQERYDEVMAALESLQAQIDARPEVQMRKLIDRRGQLAAQIGYVLEERSEEHQSRIERTSADGIYRSETRDYEALEAAARATLAAFDAAHPEVVAQINADKQADVARFLAAD